MILDKYSKIRDARDCILVGFNWSNTPQGEDYWRDVHDNLDKLLDEEVDDHE